ncbi:UNVERIFIED_ORG: putative DNA-binding transcriptional regulator AlpA [Comamonas terrigena]
MDNQITHGVHPAAPLHGANPRESEFTFHGYSKSGRAQFQCEGKRFYGVGQVERCDDARIPLKVPQMRVVPGYKANALKDQIVMAWSPKDYCWNRFTGVLIPAQSTAVEIECKVPPVSTPTPTQTGVVRKKAKASKSFEEELKRIGMARAAGLDPDMRMKHIPMYLGESRSGLYAKMEKTPQEFPSPNKRGRSSFWPLSVIDAYRKGEWEPHAGKSNPKGSV